MAEFTSILALTVVAFGAGYFFGYRDRKKVLACEEARTRKWKERAYKMAWGIPLDVVAMRETRHSMGVPKATDFWREIPPCK